MMSTLSQFTSGTVLLTASPLSGGCGQTATSCSFDLDAPVPRRATADPNPPPSAG